MAKKTLENLIVDKDQFDKPSQDIINSFVFRREELGQLDSMKNTEGWKIMDKKIREELQTRILTLVKDDQIIKTLLALLKTVDTKSMRQQLQEEIKQILPE